LESLIISTFVVVFVLICVYWSRGAERIARKYVKLVSWWPRWFRGSDDEFYANSLWIIRVNSFGAGVCAVVAFVVALVVPDSVPVTVGKTPIMFERGSWANWIGSGLLLMCLAWGAWAALRMYVLRSPPIMWIGFGTVAAMIILARFAHDTRSQTVVVTVALAGLLLAWIGRGNALRSRTSS
jgi:hypothetical protein